ncbi:MAG: N-acetylneuraminate synthase family protein [Vicinamibacterales bacterium]
MTTMTQVGLQIRGRRIDASTPLYVVAEVGLNHGGDLERAEHLVAAAADAGVAAVKLQSLRAETLVAAHCPPPMHVAVPSLRGFFEQFELSAEAHRRLARQAHAAGLGFISTPFDEPALDMLMDAGVDAIKIASGDITHLRLVARAARTGRPLILSTGMSELHEVEAAVRCATEHGAGELALLHCVSAYPVPSGAENLRAIETLARAFGLTVGLSDHSLEPLAAPLAVALGARIYERHFVAVRDGRAIDEAVSSTGAEPADVIRQCGRVQSILGHGRRECGEAERGNRRASRRGLYAARAIGQGTRIRSEDLAALRPEDGIAASAWDSVVGARATRDLAEGDVLTSDALEGAGW